MFSYLNELKEAAGNPTNAEIAERSGVPESTISKLMTGTVDNPRFQTVVDVVTTLGGSLDDLAGIAQQEHDSTRGDDPIDPMEKSIHADEAVHPMDDTERQYYRDQIDRLTAEMLQREEAMRAEYQERERLLRADARRRERWLFFWGCVLVLFIMVVLFIDLINPNIGYFRYTDRMIPDMHGLFRDMIPFV